MAAFITPTGKSDIISSESADVNTPAENKKFIDAAFSGVPSDHTDAKVIERLNGMITATLGGGKSGASVFICGNKILKLYPERDHNSVFEGDGTNDEKSDRYVNAIRGNYDADFHYFRSLRDILISSELHAAHKTNGPRFTPEVYEYGFLRDVVVQNNKLEVNRNDNSPKYIPYIITEKIEGKELSKYNPNGTVDDLKVLHALMLALKFKYTSINTEKNKHIGCHRDLHPGNIFINKKEGEGGDQGAVYTAKLIDFDLSVSNNPLITKDISCTRRNLSKGSSFVLKQHIGATMTYTGYSPKALGLNWNGSLNNREVRSDADLFNYFTFFKFFKEKQPGNIRDVLREYKVETVTKAGTGQSDSTAPDDRKLAIMDKTLSGLAHAIACANDKARCLNRGGSRRKQKRRNVTKKNKSNRRSNRRINRTTKKCRSANGCRRNMKSKRR